MNSDYQWKKFVAIPPPRLPGVIRDTQAAAVAVDSTEDTDPTLVAKQEYDAGFAQGHADGVAAAAAEQKKLLDSLAQRLADADQRHAQVLSQAMADCADVLGQLFTALFNHELSVNGELLQRLIEQAVPNLAEVDHTIQVLLCHTDYERLHPHWQPGNDTLRLLVDEALTPGTVRIVAEDALVHLDIGENIRNLLVRAVNDVATGEEYVETDA